MSLDFFKKLKKPTLFTSSALKRSQIKKWDLPEQTEQGKASNKAKQGFWLFFFWSDSNFFPLDWNQSAGVSRKKSNCFLQIFSLSLSSSSRKIVFFRLKTEKNDILLKGEKFSLINFQAWLVDFISDNKKERKIGHYFFKKSPASTSWRKLAIPFVSHTSQAKTFHVLQACH